MREPPEDVSLRSERARLGKLKARGGKPMECCYSCPAGVKVRGEGQTVKGNEGGCMREELQKQNWPFLSFLNWISERRKNIKSEVRNVPAVEWPGLAAGPGDN